MLTASHAKDEGGDQRGGGDERAEEDRAEKRRRAERRDARDDEDDRLDDDDGERSPPQGTERDGVRERDESNDREDDAVRPKLRQRLGPPGDDVHAHRRHRRDALSQGEEPVDVGAHEEERSGEGAVSTDHQGDRRRHTRDRPHFRLLPLRPFVVPARSVLRVDAPVVFAVRQRVVARCSRATSRVGFAACPPARRGSPSRRRARARPIGIERRGRRAPGRSARARSRACSAATPPRRGAGGRACRPGRRSPWASCGARSSAVRFASRRTSRFPRAPCITE